MSGSFSESLNTVRDFARHPVRGIGSLYYRNKEASEQQELKAGKIIIGTVAGLLALRGSIELGAWILGDVSAGNIPQQATELYDQAY